MKNILVKSSVILILLTALLGCVDAAGTAQPSVTPETPYTANFTDQELQGTIAGLSFVYASGYAENSGFGDDEYIFEIRNIDSAGGGLFYYPIGAEYLGLLFSLPKSVGVYELSEFQTLTFVDSTTSDGIDNTVTSRGVVEILEINTTTNKITGRMDVVYNDNYSVNGNFTLDLR